MFKFGFIKGVDEGLIATVKDRESPQICSNLDCERSNIGLFPGKYLPRPPINIKYVFAFTKLSWESIQLFDKSKQIHKVDIDYQRKKKTTYLVVSKQGNKTKQNFLENSKDCTQILMTPNDDETRWPTDLRPTFGDHVSIFVNWQTNCCFTSQR